MSGLRHWSRPATVALVAGVLLLGEAGCVGRGSGRPPNIVLILIDTLRADHVGAYGYERDTTPTIDRLAGEGALFESAFSTASYTRAATGSLFTGQYPSVHGAVSTLDSLSDSVPTLSQILGDAGYQTVGFVLNGNVSADFGFGRAFDRYETPARDYRLFLREQGASTAQLRRQVDDRAVTWNAVSFLRGDRTEPFFLYLHFSGPHGPYAPPPEARSFLEGPLTSTSELFYREQESPRTRDFRSVMGQMQLGAIPVDAPSRRQFVDLYDGEIAFTDGQVGQILEVLEEQGLAKDTVTIVTSDHGEEFWEHGGMAHGHSHFQELLRIPLVMAGPGIRRRTVAAPVSLADVMPTIVELAGLEPPEDLPSQSLAPVVRSAGREPPRRPIYAEGLLRFDGSGMPVSFFRSLQLEEWKLVVDGRKRRKSLFNLGLDPRESRDVLAGNPVVGRDLLQKLKEHHHRNLDSAWLGPERLADMSPDTEDSLRALGYVTGGPAVTAGSVFRRPLATPEVSPLGFLGDEREASSYRSAFLFEEGDPTADEQLLYGWQAGPESRAVMKREAGVRLRRDRTHTEWRVVGWFPGPGGSDSGVARLRVRVNGTAEPAREVRTPGPFELRGALSRPAEPFVRLDLECSGGPLSRGRGEHDEDAPCCLVGAVELR